MEEKNQKEKYELYFNTPSDAYIRFLQAEKAVIELRKIYATARQIICTLENIPQMLILGAFFVFDFDPYLMYDPYFQTLPNAAHRGNFFFILSCLHSFISAMSAIFMNARVFVKSAAERKSERAKIASKKFWFLFLSVTFQLAGQVLIFVYLFWLTVYNHPLFVLPYFILMFIRSLLILLVYTCIKSFRDLPWTEKLFHIFSNTFVVNPLPITKKVLPKVLLFFAEIHS